MIPDTLYEILPYLKEPSLYRTLNRTSYKYVHNYHEKISNRINNIFENKLTPLTGNEIDNHMNTIKKQYDNHQEYFICECAGEFYDDDIKHYFNSSEIKQFDDICNKLNDTVMIDQPEDYPISKNYINNLKSNHNGDYQIIFNHIPSITFSYDYLYFLKKCGLNKTFIRGCRFMIDEYSDRYSTSVQDVMRYCMFEEEKDFLSVVPNDWIKIMVVNNFIDNDGACLFLNTNCRSNHFNHVIAYYPTDESHCQIVAKSFGEFVDHLGKWGYYYDNFTDNSQFEDYDSEQSYYSEPLNFIAWFWETYYGQ
jgi:hypothetical protein